MKYYRAAFWNNRKVFFDFAPNQEIATGINLMHEYSNNYFHFVAETLPRLVLADEAGLPTTCLSWWNGSCMKTC